MANPQPEGGSFESPPVPIWSASRAGRERVDLDRFWNDFALDVECFDGVGDWRRSGFQNDDGDMLRSVGSGTWQDNVCRD
jgi:hypothetical protein